MYHCSVEHTLHVAHAICFQKLRLKDIVVNDAEVFLGLHSRLPGRMDAVVLYSRRWL